MSAEQSFPVSANCEQLAAYFEWHCQMGRGNWRVEIREHYPVIPPQGDTHDEQEKVIFLRGVF